MPLTFLSNKKSKSAPPERLFTYDRDIMCLPKAFVGNGGLVKIPRKQCVCEFLAANNLIGKIGLMSAMSEEKIMDEICSVFEEPVNRDKLFRFEILLTFGGSSKSLSVPVRSASFKWTASSVAGKNTCTHLHPGPRQTQGKALYAHQKDILCVSCAYTAERTYG